MATMTADTHSPERIGRRIAADLADNDHFTAEPIFLVQQRRRYYGLDTDFTDNIAWLYEDEAVEIPDEDARRLESEWNGSEPEGVRRTGYFDTWEFVQCFFTREAAEQYIERNRHNMKDPRVYVDSGHRNPEWQALREHLMGQSAIPPQRPQQLGGGSEGRRF